MVYMRARRFLIALVAVVFVVISTPIFGGTQATIKQLTGKVEIRLADGRWIAAERGMVIDTGALISTGIGSTAVLEVGESTLDIKPLTRMAIDELVTEGGVQTTTLSLRVGKVRADVKTTGSVSHDFKIRSPISTAAVRGTVFSFDGERLETEAGLVNVGNGTQNVNVGPNQRATIRENQAPRVTVAARESHGQVDAPVPGSQGKSGEHQNKGRGKGPGWEDTTTGFGTVTVEWR